MPSKLDISENADEYVRGLKRVEKQQIRLVEEAGRYATVATTTATEGA